MAEKERKKPHYTTVIDRDNDKAYDEVTVFLGESSLNHESNRYKDFYFFDESGEKVVRTSSSRRRVELSNMMDKEIQEIIIHIIHTNKIGGGE